MGSFCFDVQHGRLGRRSCIVTSKKGQRSALTSKEGIKRESAIYCFSSI